jgi:hypothetical protein
MLDLDIVMSAGETKARRGLQGVPSGIVEFSDQTF